MSFPRNLGEAFVAFEVPFFIIFRKNHLKHYSTESMVKNEVCIVINLASQVVVNNTVLLMLTIQLDINEYT